MKIFELAARAAELGDSSDEFRRLRAFLLGCGRPYIVAADFDGTLCEENWPGIGAEKARVLGALILLKRLGAVVILWTCREADSLDEAVAWCAERGLAFTCVNRNCPEVLARFGGWDSRKINADEYWDDKSVSPS